MDPLFAAARSLRADYERVDWARTPLGPAGDWSPALRGAVGLVLGSRFAVALFGGPELVLVYNEAYRDMIGDKHPAALGAPAREVFPEVWTTIGPMFERVAAGGTVWTQNERLLMLRHGFLEETFFTFSYSPVRDAQGAVRGVLDIAAETTEQVRSLRRLATVTQLSERLNRLLEPGHLRDQVLPVLRAAGEDLVAIDIRTASRGDGDPRLPANVPESADAALSFEQTAAGTVAWLPLRRAGSTEQVWLVALVSPHLRVDDSYRAFLRLLASSLAMALERSRVREIERRRGEASRAMSETFQRSLLTTPTVPPGYELAVHYRAAAREAQVGGDWYDSFELPDGTVTVVVGDVTGHDQDSAAAMAQVRNLLRGVSFTVQQGPAGVLTVLDEAMHGLRTKSLATAVVGQVLPDGELQWSNAGHPPPVLVEPDGTARLLATPPEILLGVRTRALRTDHLVTLEPGATFIMYSDGLVERRGERLDVSIAALTDLLTGASRMSVDQVCTLLLDRYTPNADDDVVLLVLRRRPD